MSRQSSFGNKLYGVFGNKLPPLEVIATSEQGNSELSYHYGLNETDPRYFLLGKELIEIGGERYPGKAVFGETGMIESIFTVEDKKDVPVFERGSGFGVFEPGKIDADLALVIDEIYSEIAELDFLNRDKEMFNFSSKKLSKRFKAVGKLTKGKIVPDMEDITIPVDFNDGCFQKCYFCDQASKKGPSIYPMWKINWNIWKTKRVLRKYHRDELENMDKIFFLSNDVLMNYMFRGPDVRDVVDRAAMAFPHALKREAFVSAPSVNWVYNKHPGLLDDLFRPERINRVLYGPETLDDRLSIRLNVPISAKNKILAAKRLLDCGIKLKTIFQIGFGRGFYDTDGKYVPMIESVEKTAESMLSIVEMANAISVINAGDLKATVEISRYQHSDKTGMQTLYDKGIIKPYKNPEKEIRQEEEVFRQVFMEAAFNSRDVIRFDYEQALPCHGSRLIK